MPDSTTDDLPSLPVDDAQINHWVEQFHRDGFLLIKNVLPPDLVQLNDPFLPGAGGQRRDVQQPGVASRRTE